MKKTSVAEIFYKYAGYICVVLISVIYVFGSMLVIEKTGRSVYEILATGMLSMLVGILINSIFRGAGIRRGDEDEKMRSTVSLHARAVEEIIPYIDRLDEYCEKENKRAKKSIRARILAEEGLKYEDYFDSDGILLEGVGFQGEKQKNIDGVVKKLVFKYRELKKRRAIYKAQHLKIKPLTPSSLTAFGEKSENPFDFGKSKSQYSSSHSVLDVLSRLAMAIIFGYFGVTLLSDINVSSIIWSLLQIIMYLSSGIIQMYTSQMWVLDTYRAGIIRKIDQLEKFKLYVSVKTE